MIGVYLRPEAELDVRAIALWYEDEDPGLGDQFVRQLEVSVRNIAELPSQFPVVTPGVRRALLRRFPYGIYFVVDPARIVVLGVFHQHRDPTAWRERL